MQQLIRVLVVDDSAFLRKVVTQMLSRSPFIEVVGTARDGDEALEMTESLRPDVVTLDLVMPGRDGVGYLREQMVRRPLPVVLCSIAHESADMTLQAFEAGAVDFVQKPTALATERVFEIADELIAKVKAAAGARVAQQRPDPAPAATLSPRASGGAQIIVIGISTGGPQALRRIIPQLPADLPVPVAMVLHMPVGYTEMYARRLNDISSLEVIESRGGEKVVAGQVLLAPAGQHLTFGRSSEGVVSAALGDHPLDTQHRPAADVLFRSAAEVYGAGAVGVVMTGMGDDGLVGAAHIKALGGRIITEAESSCVVYGMPRAVEEAGLSDRVVPLDEIAHTILEML